MIRTWEKDGAGYAYRFGLVSDTVTFIIHIQSSLESNQEQVSMDKYSTLLLYCSLLLDRTDPDQYPKFLVILRTQSSQNRSCSRNQVKQDTKLL